ncbi:MAG: thioredoxin family protein [Bacteroidaceae bacterium]|nr:thioredoxin family protein [Bacteroidaceae bacterium]
MKKISISLLLFLMPLLLFAQMMDPVKFSSSMKMLGGDQAEIVFSAKIDPGWHVYSTNLGDAGPIEASFHGTKMDGVELVGKLTPRGKEINHFDNMFGCNLRYFENSAQFVQKVKFTKPEYDINCYLEWGACNDEMCMPPGEATFKQKGKSPETPQPPKGESLNETNPQNANKAADATANKAETTDATADAPPVSEAPASADSTSVSSDSASVDTAVVKSAPESNESLPLGGNEGVDLWMIFLAGLAGGFVALLTPCVWPIIPMTVSFFLKRNKDHKSAVHEALIYGASIVVIYVLLGLIVTLLFGASALNSLSTNAWFNIFFCLLLVVFAASFFGAFEITMPSSWSNAIDKKSNNSTGLISIFFMAFTLALVSFSCTGPIIGFLLVAVGTQGEFLAPLIGMLGFAIALAIPFTVFAMFPSLLKAAPKSGGWMNTIKVVLGFIELAFALKFLSVADLAYGWHILDREVFLSLWIVIFALLGVYLLGWLKFPHDDAMEYTELGEQVPTFGRTNVPQFFLGMASLAFAVYMIPGLWGAPLKAVSAFAPPMNTQDFVLSAGGGEGENKNVVEAKYKDYDEAMAVAKKEGKPLMIDFTGFGCVNCRKMEAAVWTNPEVAKMLNDEYILVSLFVDDKTPLEQEETVTENGQERTLRTIGDKWSYLQRSKYKANTQPFYVLTDNEGNQLGDTRSYNEDIPAYIDFLKKGLEMYRGN